MMNSVHDNINLANNVYTVITAQSRMVFTADLRLETPTFGPHDVYTKLRNKLIVWKKENKISFTENYT